MQRTRTNTYGRFGGYVYIYIYICVCSICCEETPSEFARRASTYRYTTVLTKLWVLLIYYLCDGGTERTAEAHCRAVLHANRRWSRNWCTACSTIEFKGFAPSVLGTYISPRRSGGMSVQIYSTAVPPPTPSQDHPLVLHPLSEYQRSPRGVPCFRCFIWQQTATTPTSTW